MMIMGMTMGVFMFLNGLAVLLVAVIFAIFVDEVDDKSKRRKEPDAKHEKVHEEHVKNTSDEPHEYTVIIPDPSPAEVALLAANRQSFQLNLDMLDAQRLLAETARRHELDPTPAEWYHDAEWRA